MGGITLWAPRVPSPARQVIRRWACSANRGWSDARRRSVDCSAGVHRRLASAQARVRPVRRRWRLSAEELVRPRAPSGKLVIARCVPAGKWLLSGRSSRLWASVGSAQPDVVAALVALLSPARTEGPGHHGVACCNSRSLSSGCIKCTSARCGGHAAGSPPRARTTPRRLCGGTVSDAVGG